jgi:AcrR family transcriptional regulator
MGSSYSMRRMGSQSSETRSALIEAVETVMLQQGYGALTARNVADAAGLKHQLVYYYFRTMDDLLLEAFRQRTAHLLAQVEAAVSSDRPLNALWRVYSQPEDAALTIEYMALANHNEVIRDETVRFGEMMRRIGLENIRTSPDIVDAPLTPQALASVIRCIASILGMEAALGITGAHQETRSLTEWCLDRLESPATE